MQLGQYTQIYKHTCSSTYPIIPLFLPSPFSFSPFPFLSSNTLAPLSHSFLPQVCGVCVHQGYSTAAGVVAAVHGAGVHLTQAPGVEFALALHLHAYPGQVLSVWVYVAALVQRA